MAKQLARARDVAEYLDLPEARIYALARANGLPKVEIGRSVRFDMEEVEAWVKAGGSTTGVELATTATPSQ